MTYLIFKTYWKQHYLFFLSIKIYVKIFIMRLFITDDNRLIGRFLCFKNGLRTTKFNSNPILFCIPHKVYKLSHNPYTPLYNSSKTLLRHEPMLFVHANDTKGREWRMNSTTLSPSHFLRLWAFLGQSVTPIHPAELLSAQIEQKDGETKQKWHAQLAIFLGKYCGETRDAMVLANSLSPNAEFLF